MALKLVYIAHRLGVGPDREQNRLEAERWMVWAAERGAVPIAPWVFLARFWDESRRELCMRLNGEALRRCDEFWMCGVQVGRGMLEQRELAESHGLVIRRYLQREPQP